MCYSAYKLWQPAHLSDLVVSYHVVYGIYRKVYTEKKLNITVLSSNQTLIWDTLISIKNKETTKGFGKIFEVN